MNPSNPAHRRLALLFFILGGIWCAPPYIQAQSPAGNALEMEWDGHVKVYARALFPRSGTAFDQIGLDTNYDGSLELRVNNKTFFSDAVYAEVNWEAALAGGGTRRDGRRLNRLYPAVFPKGLFLPPTDNRRLFDLTAKIDTNEETFSYHRLDRAMVAFMPAWGEVRLGRQAVTWGHGFTFNPMDLFNPFSPTDLERNYKMGDDMALVRFPIHNLDVECLYVVRRDPETGQTGFHQNSLGTNIHSTAGEIEINLILARHYEDYVAGIGFVGYFGDAAWRFDITGTRLHEPGRGQSWYASAVANIDTSWTWLGKNVYGYLELYYNGLSRDNYKDHYTDPAISQRITRGELFALGSLYCSANIHLEIHPLINAYLTPVVNLNDGSGVLLPRVVYDMSDTLRLTVTGALNWGAKGTEYGGYDVPGVSFSHTPTDSVSIWITWYY